MRLISRIGQCASLRKVDGEWKIYMLQMTPLSVNASELEAYPFAFVGDEPEVYHMQEQMSELMRLNTIAIYKINFSANMVEYYVAKNEYSVKVTKGEKYERAIFRSANLILNDDDRLRFIEIFSIGNVINSYESGKHELSFEYEALQHDGAEIWLRSEMRLYNDKNKELKGYLYLIDIDRQKKLELEMLRRAETDSMTGLFNKQITQEKVNTILQRKDRGTEGAFLMLDIDFFKQINDTFGHSEGDRVIRATAEILKKNARSTDIVGRLGGDEFGIYYDGGMSQEMVCRRAEAICEMIREIHPAGEEGVFTSCSIGIALLSGESCFNELYEKADKALYVRKKEQGRNGFTFYQE